MAIILLDHQLSVRHWTSLLARHFIMSHAMDNSSFWHCSQTLKPTSTVNVKVHYICTLYIVKVHVHLYINCTKQEWLCFFNTTKFMVLMCFSIQWLILLFIYEKVTFKLFTLLAWFWNTVEKRDRLSTDSWGLLTS